MALNGKYVSSAEVIRQVYRDNKYKYQLPWQDAVEWAVESIRLIGAPLAKRPEQACIPIVGFRGMLPCDLDSLHQVAGSSGKGLPFPMRSATNTFHSVFICDVNQIFPELLAEAGIPGITEEPIGVDIAGNPVYDVSSSGGNASGLWAFPQVTVDQSNVNTSFDPTYTVNDNYIFTNFKTGFVFLAYDALPVDKEGFPLIPDNQRYIEAVKCFIRWKTDYILWRSNELSKEIYKDSEAEWLYYVGSAGNAARIPNLDGMQSLMNQIKMIPSKYEHDRFFLKLGAK